ncbi:MAG: transcription elongation factor GreA [Planctomycetota bacterium]
MTATDEQAVRGSPAHDRWAHRRAEPRMFAFLWAVYLLAAGLSTLGVALTRGPWTLLDKSVYQHAARIMLVCVALGVAVLWPMVRLSQQVPASGRSWRAIAKDLVVLVLPVQAVLWAQAAARSGWALDLIAAMSAALLAWPLLLGALLAAVLRGPSPAPRDGAPRSVFAGVDGPSAATRSLAMAAVIALALLPLLALATGPAWAAMLSPVSAVVDLARERDVGPAASSVVDGRWAALAALGAAAVVAWLGVCLLEIASPPARGEGPEGARPGGEGPSGRSPADQLASPSVPGTDDHAQAGPRTEEHSPMDIITPEEKAKLQQRLADLIANRPKISARIAEARALGDLKENAEYHSTRELQGLEEAEIRRIEERLGTAQVVDDDLAKDAQVVFLGCMVKIREVGNDVDEMVKLVGEFSDDPPDDYDEVTVASPMGNALMKARVGETVRVNAPRGVKRFEVVEIL